MSQTGVQVLTGFLLTLPLQPTFADLSTLERNLYVVAISLSILATGLLVAPVSMHRVLFRKRRKESLVEVGSWVAKAGLTTLALASTAVTAFVFSIVFTESTGLWAGAVTLASSPSRGWSCPCMMQSGTATDPCWPRGLASGLL